ncbi:MAG: hypothetical protein A3D94_03490 [Alphaproteobacteria bacterium RIFCSPHIGHO2_12_FULL_66_14]|jgi:hypothetical protein|nr:MAG: hypothetical protein A3D94_03490 [Alphaproteobacteria bacterium RIFCSPHIGHO2_12_FULL_66_14]
MTAGPKPLQDGKHRHMISAAVVVLCVVAAALFVLLDRAESPGSGATIGEKLTALRAERASLQARAGGEARVGLLPAFRAASLLTDALAARYEPDAERVFDRLPLPRRQAFAEIDRLNAAIKDALDRPGEGARQAARKAAERAMTELERIAGLDDAPLVLAYTPRFVPPRRATGELTLTPGAAAAAPPDGALRLGLPSGPAGSAAAPSLATPPSTGPTVPRYAPSFATASGDDPAVEVEVVGVFLTSGGGPPPVLAIGVWRGEANIAPERLRFSVPRSTFANDAVRTTFASGSLIVRRGSRTTTFQLLFTVLPDRPGSFALDQRVRTTEPESNTLVSPEILARAPAGETRTVRRCFDPPPDWRFDKDRRRVVIVERLGWLDDIADPTMNAGSVEFVSEDKSGQICVAVVARPATKAARTATIGRFEATLVRDRPVERVVQSGIRALDWREPARMPLEPGMVEWKLYVRLFDEIDREFDRVVPSGLAFLHIALEADGKILVLQADPTADP